jgi:hypothetical protein
LCICQERRVLLVVVMKLMGGYYRGKHWKAAVTEGPP